MSAATEKEFLADLLDLASKLRQEIDSYARGLDPTRAAIRARRQRVLRDRELFVVIGHLAGLSHHRIDGRRAFATGLKHGLRLLERERFRDAGLIGLRGLVRRRPAEAQPALPRGPLRRPIRGRGRRVEVRLP